MKGAVYIAEFLARIGVERAYTLSGGMIAPLLDAIGEHPALRLVAMSHEQAAGFAAENEAKLSGVPGIAIGTNGPGALNLVTCIASAYCDSVPSIFIGGQVQTYLADLVPNGRQSGLQQADFAAVCQPIAKAVIRVRKAIDLPIALNEAYLVAMGGRPGPVVLDLPLDVQIGETRSQAIEAPELPTSPLPNEGQVTRLAADLRTSTRPVVLVGGGAHGAETACRRFVGTRSLPLVSTTAALDIAPAQCIGMCGMYGSRTANTVLSEADLVLVLGSRLDHAVLGGDPAGFARKRRIWHVDIDPGEAGVRVRPSEVLVADVGVTLAALEAADAENPAVASNAWRNRVAKIVERFPTSAEQPPLPGIDPNAFVSRLGLASAAAAAYVVDAGQHTWWVGQSLDLREGQRFLTSTGLHACGTAIPGAIAAALYLRRPVMLVAGDGSIQLNIQDLATVAREALPVKAVVINNAAHGSVRQLQVEATPGRHHAAVWGLAQANLPSVFEAYGVPARRITRPDEVGAALEWLWDDPARAQMLDVTIDTELLVRPAVSFGRQISAMTPTSQGPPY